MKKIVKYIGLDVHKNSISISIAEEGRNTEVRYFGQVDNDMTKLDKILRKFISQGAELNCVYEAGPCGYHIYRHLTGNGIRCSVIAPSRIPRKSGDRIKNDRRDSQSLARLHRAGELVPIYVPTPEDESLRDLVRAREDCKNAQKKAKQQLGAFLLRHNIIYSGRTAWSKAHFVWLTTITMNHYAQQFVLQEYIDTVNDGQRRVDRLTEQMRQISKQSCLNPLIESLQSMRGISFIVAFTLAAELGDLKRFSHPKHLMAFVGLIPSEHSSGKSVKRGSITKTGNTHVRKVLVEAAQAYRFPARKSRAIVKRQEKLPSEIIQLSWEAQCRLCSRYRALTDKGKNANVAKVAIARELTGFIWATAHKVLLPA